MLDYFSDYLPAQLIIPLNDTKAYSFQNTKPLQHHTSLYYSVMFYLKNKILLCNCEVLNWNYIIKQFINLDQHNKE